MIREEKKFVRDTVDKVKCLVVFGMSEERVVDKIDREEKEREKIQKILAVATEEEGLTGSSVDEFFRIGKFEDNKHRPMKIKFATQAMAEEVLNGSWRLAENEELKNVLIIRDLDEGERLRVKELVAEAKEKNDQRTEEEKKFYWKVRNFQLRRKFFRR